MRDKSSRIYQKASRRGKSAILRRPWILPLLGVVLGILIVAGVVYSQKDSPTLRPSDSHVVYVYSDGRQQTVSTKAQTVGELISRLDLNISEQDVIEPSVDTPIVEDNFRINVYRARPVTVIDGGVKTVTLTAQKSPRVVAATAGLKINAEDIAKFEQGSLAENIIGEKVVIARATPILLNLYGAQLTTYTQAKTVAGLLAEKNVKLSDGETVSPGPDTPITPNMQIFVLGRGTSVASIEEPIEPPVQYIADAALSFGATAVRQPGTPGKVLKTYLISAQDGQEPVRQLIHETVITAPITQIVARGTAVTIDSDKTKLMNAAGIKASDHNYVNYIVSRESGWCPTKWQGEYGKCLPYHGTPAGGGYGLVQATPGSKMASAGADWGTNPVTQLKWAHGYALSRYGSWAAAYNYWLSHHNW